METRINQRRGVVRSLVLLSALSGLAGCTQKLPTLKQVEAPTISSFSASPASIINGSTTTLSWAATGATGVAITPGTFASTSGSGSVVLSPTATTTYTLTATNTTGTATATVIVTVTQPTLPTISSFTANPTSVSLGGISTLSWASSGATTLNIAPGNLASTSASGTVNVSPETTTTYVLTATNAAGSVTASATVTLTSAGGPLSITTASCPGGTQNTAYAGCTIAATGGNPPYTFSVDDSGDYPPLPEGLALEASSGEITSPLIGGQGTYTPEIIVTDATGATAKAQIVFRDEREQHILGKRFYFGFDLPSSRGCGDNESASRHIAGGADVQRLFAGDDQAVLREQLECAVSEWNSGDRGSGEPAGCFGSDDGVPVVLYFGTDSGLRASGGHEQLDGDRHVLVYLEPGNGNNPALYEMWQGIYLDGPWTDSSNAEWPNVATDALTPQGQGTSDAAGLPVGPLLANADEVIGTGTPTAPNGTVQHPIRFTLNHMLNYWVWPATQTAGVGSCEDSSGDPISVEGEISQATPPSSCTMSGAAGEIYRLKASVATPTCAATSPQAAIIITGFRNYGIILADNGDSGGLIGTPDARWNDADLSCLTSLILSDFEPVNVSSLMVTNDSGATSH